MLRSVFSKTIIAVCFGLVLLPAAASAQSGIAGVVKDATGAVLPGVTVEAASDALIEKVRTVVSDEAGLYKIVDLRPGTYTITFTLAGFNAFKREGLELPSNFTATVNADLKVGAMEESVTVSGQSPIVDMQNAQRTTAISRELLDAVPMPRMFIAESAMAVGTKVTGQNVGGTRAANNPRIVAHGSQTKDTTVSVDGMKMNTLNGGGDSQPDHNDAMSQEMTVQTASIGADVSAGGPNINLIPREGGNIYSGATYLGFSNGSMQFDNLSADLVNRGLATPDAMDKVFDSNISVGGPIKRDKLWFFASARNVGNNNIVANSFYPDGRPGIYDVRVRNATVRLTWQINPKNKLSVYDDYQWKTVGHTFTSGVDVATASRMRPPVLKYTDAIKWNSTSSNRFAFDVAYGTAVNAYREGYQPGIAKERFTPAWYANAGRTDTNKGTTWTASAPETGTFNFRYMLISTMQYVTGSHALKAGMQWHIGQTWNTADANADLLQRYKDSVPDTVLVYNTPVKLYSLMGADLGLYVQDSWTLKRLTINPGLRFEYFNSSQQPMGMPAGRFVPAREFGAIPNIPNWKNLAPRFSVVYDLTGDAKTAVKAAVNKYNRAYTTDYAGRYNPLVLQTDTRNWSDCAYLPGQSTCDPSLIGAPGYHDDIAQNNEIGPSNNLNFGLAPARRPDPKIKRPYDLEYSVAVDRQLFSGFAVTGAWYRRATYNLEQQTNTLVSVSDYAVFETPSPLNNGESVTVYNLNKTKQGQVDLLDTTATDRSKSRVTYTGLELSFTARLPRGGSFFGGWASEKGITVACAGNDPNTFRYCDQSKLGIPFTNDFKFNGSYPLPFGVQVGAALQSYAGAPLAVNWSVPTNLFPGGRTQAVTVNLVAPGSKYLDRWNQLDLSFHKVLRVGRARIDTALDVFNALNSNVVLQQNQNFGSSLDQPQQILQGRMLRVSNQIKF